jgi:hypothetical protein
MEPDAATLTEVLRAGGWLSPGDRVAGVRVVPMGTYSSRLSRLQIDYELASGTRTGAGSDPPRSLVLKSSVPGRNDRLGESLANEIRFHRELAAGLPVRTPRFYGGRVAGEAGSPGGGTAEHGHGRDGEREDVREGEGEDDGAAWLLLEDVSGLQPVDWLQGPGEEHARLAVGALARMHAAGFGERDGLDWVPSFADEALLEAFEHEYAEGWSRRRELLLEVVPEFASIGDALVGRVAASHRPLAEHATLLHGDAHAENMPLCEAADGSDVVLLDWAGPRIGHPGVDLGFFIAMSFPSQRRARVERALVAQHADVLRATGALPPTDPWLAYRRGVLRRASRTVAIAADWPADGLAGLKMIFQRCAVAAIELGVEELIV